MFKPGEKLVCLSKKLFDSNYNVTIYKNQTCRFIDYYVDETLSNVIIKNKEYIYSSIHFMSIREQRKLKIKKILNDKK